MRDPKRIDRILKLLGPEWKKYPDMRLGQFLVYVMNGKLDLFSVEDDEIEVKLKEFIKKNPLEC